MAGKQWGNLNKKHFFGGAIHRVRTGKEQGKGTNKTNKTNKTDKTNRTNKTNETDKGY